MAKKIIYTLEIQGTDTQVQNLNKIEKELKDVTNEISRLKKEQKGKTEVDRAEQAEINKLIVKQKELRMQYREQERSLQQTINYQNAEVGSLKKVEAELSILRKRVKEFTDTSSTGYQQTTKRIKELEQKQRDYNQAIGRGTTFVGEYARGFQTAFMKIGAGITAAMVLIGQLNRIFGQSIKDFKEWEQGLVNVQTLLFQGVDVTLEQRATLLAKEHGLAIQELTKAYFDAVSAGNSVKDSEVLLNQAAILAKAGVTSLAVATDGMTSVLNAYRLGMDEAERVASAFFTAQKFGKTTVAELASEIGVVAPIARQAGISFQELLATFAELTKQGIRTPEAATAIKNMVVALIKPSEQAKDAMDSLGIAYGATAIKQQGFFNILTKIVKAGEENADVIAQIIPNIRALTGVGALGSEALEEFDYFLKTITEDFGEGSSLMKGYAQQMETSMEKGKVFAAGMRAVRIEIGERLAPAMNALKSVILTVAEWFARNLDLILRLGRAVTQITGIWFAYQGVMILINSAKLAQIAITKSLTAAQVIEGSTLKGNTVITTAFIAIKKAYTAATASQTVATKAATVAQRAWNLVLKANPIGLAVTALTAFVTILTLIPKKLNTIQKVQEDLNNIELQAKTNTVEQAFEIQKLVKVIESETASNEEKLAAQQRLTEISPKYLSTINAETIANGQAKIAIDQYIKSLQEKYRLEAIEAKIKEIQTERLRVEAGEGIEANMWQKGMAAMIGYGNAAAKNAYDIRTFVKNRGEQLKELSEQEQYYQAQLTTAIEGTAQTGEQVQANYKAELNELKNANKEALKGTAEYIKQQIELENKAYQDKITDYQEEVEDELTKQELIEEATILHNKKILELQNDLQSKLKSGRDAAIDEEAKRLQEYKNQLETIKIENIDEQAAQAIIKEQQRYDKQIAIYNAEVKDLKLRNDLIQVETLNHNKSLLDIFEKYKISEVFRYEIYREKQLYDQGINDFQTYINDVMDIIEDAQLAKTVREIYDLELNKINDFVTQAIDAENKRWEEQSVSLEQGSVRYLTAMEQHIANLQELQEAAEAAKAMQVPFEFAEEVNVEDSPEVIALQETLDFKLQMIREAAKTNVEYAQQLADDLIKIDEARYQKQSTIYEASSDLAIASLGVVLQFAKKGSALEKALIVTMKAIEVAKVIIKMAASNAAITFAATAQIAAMPLAAPGIIANMVAMKTLNKINAAAAIATIVGQTIAEFKAAKGYIVKGKGTPTSDNIHALVSPGEAIINAKSMQDSDVLTVTGTPKQIASEINSYKGYGIKFAEGKAPVYSPSVRTVTEPIPKDLIRGIVQETVAGIVNIPVVISEREMTTKQRMVQLVEKEGDF